MENSKKFRPDPKLRLMDQVRQGLRYHHYAYRTEQTYCDWIMRYIRYHGGKTHPLMKSQVEAVEKLHQEDLADGYGEVYLPGALARKYPNAAKSFGWQYVFPSKTRSTDPRSDKTRRHHVLESGLQKAVKAAVGKAGLTKPVGCHTFRHCAVYPAS